MDKLTTTNTYMEVLVLCTCFLNYEVVSHAGTFLRQESSNGKVLIKYYDPNENHFFERGGHRIDYQDFFKRFEIITVYALQGRHVVDEERDRINNKMARIMTGKREHVIENKKKGGVASQTKRSRKSKGWRNTKANK